MGAKAYILVTAEPQKTRVVFDLVRAIQDALVIELLGPYDMIVELHADTPEGIYAVLRDQIRPIQGITTTITCMCV